MNFIEEIKKPIQQEMQLFEKTFLEPFDTKNTLLLDVNKYVSGKKGKQLRPMLVILAAKLCGVANQNTIDGAHALELLHTASLIHDDVVDDTLERRGIQSINAQWSNKIAVFSGDYMFSNALFCALKTKNLEILNAVSKIGRVLTDGELLQLTNFKISSLSEENYYSIIQKKTAQLFSSCAEVGGLSAGANNIELEHLRKFGEYLGMCFQIKDDIFDYFENIQIGKPTGNDIRDGKVTLPLIYALQNSNSTESEKIINWLENSEFTLENIQTITQFAHDKGGITYSIQKMEEFKNRAITELSSFENGDIKEALIKCAEYAALRNF